MFFFNDTATTEIYTLSLHDALPILQPGGRADHARRRHRPLRGQQQPARRRHVRLRRAAPAGDHPRRAEAALPRRSEEHTSELQSRQYLVCRLLLEKKTRYAHLPFIV